MIHFKHCSLADKLGIRDYAQYQSTYENKQEYELYKQHFDNFYNLLSAGEPLAALLLKQAHAIVAADELLLDKPEIPDIVIDSYVHRANSSSNDLALMARDLIYILSLSVENDNVTFIKTDDNEQSLTEQIKQANTQITYIDPTSQKSIDDGQLFEQLAKDDQLRTLDFTSTDYAKGFGDNDIRSMYLTINRLAKSKQIRIYLKVYLLETVQSFTSYARPLS